MHREIEQLRAEEQQYAAKEAAHISYLEHRIEAGASGAEHELREELTRQAVETGPPGPSAKSDPEEWRAFFQYEYGRDMPLNAVYMAEKHRIEMAAPPDVGGMAASYFEANYPVGFDDAELAAEWQGITLDELYAQQNDESSSEPAAAGHRWPTAEAASWPGTVSGGLAAAAARNGAVSRTAKSVRRAVGRVRRSRSRT